MPKITKRLVESVKSQKKDYVVWDSDLPGFGLRVFASGKRSYVNLGEREGQARTALSLNRRGSTRPGPSLTRHLMPHDLADPRATALRHQLSQDLIDCNRYS